MPDTRTPKRTFHELRQLLLLELIKGKQTINHLAKTSGVNWKTTDNHLTYLIGKGYVIEVFNSPYVRIFELTDKGREIVANIEGLKKI